MNVSELAAVHLTFEELRTMWLVPLAGLSLLSVAWMVSWGWDSDDAEKAGLKARRLILLTTLTMGGLLGMAFGGVDFINRYNEKYEPVRAANGAAVQEWAQDTYGVTVSGDDSRSAAGQAKALPDREHAVTVRGPDGRMQDVLMRVTQDGDLYLMDSSTRKELTGR